MTKSPVKLSDKIRTPFVLLYAIFCALRAFLTGAGVPSKPRAFRAAAALSRALGTWSTLGVHRLTSPLRGTEKRYLKLAKSSGFKPNTLVLEGGLKAHWIGDSNAERVLLYFHGGGYVLSILDGHYAWLDEWTRQASEQKSTATLVLSYTLAPEATYPTQLRESVQLLNHMLTAGGRRPSQLLLGGDSAGGNLALATLTHLLHPHPQIAPIHIKEPLAGVLLISPWVEFIDQDATFKAHKKFDILGEGIGIRWGDAYRGGAPLDNYMQMREIDASWYRDLKSVVSKVFVWAGNKECLLGSITEFTATLKKVHPNVEFFVEDDAVHIDAFFGASLLPKNETSGTRRIGQFLAAA